MAKKKKRATMTPQNRDVLDYIHRNGKISTMVAFEELGITRLPARIGDLKELGYQFDKKTITVKKENGRVSRWAEYRFAESEDVG